MATELNNNDEQKEALRLRRNGCIVNIMKCHRKILYGRTKVNLTGPAKDNDDLMLRTINYEVTKLLRWVKCR